MKNLLIINYGLILEKKNIDHLYDYRTKAFYKFEDFMNIYKNENKSFKTITIIIIKRIIIKQSKRLKTINKLLFNYKMING